MKPIHFRLMLFLPGIKELFGLYFPIYLPFINNYVLQKVMLVYKNINNITINLLVYIYIYKYTAKSFGKYRKSKDQNVKSANEIA